MKRIIFVFVLVLIISNAFSQGFSGGMFGGLNTSWVSTDSKLVEPEGVKIGYTFGVAADFGLTDNFAITSAIQFANVGGGLKFKYGAYKITASEVEIPEKLKANTQLDFNINYINIPIGLKGKTNEIGYVTYFLKGGVTPMFRSKALADINVIEDNLDPNDLLVNDHVKMLNFGWHLGGGIEYSLAGNTRLLLELVYTGGLMDFTKVNAFIDKFQVDQSNPKTSDPATRLNDIHLKVGILF
jgi:opacity protein-like surface antigen